MLGMHHRLHELPYELFVEEDIKDKGIQTNVLIRNALAKGQQKESSPSLFFYETR